MIPDIAWIHRDMIEAQLIFFGDSSFVGDQKFPSQPCIPPCPCHCQWEVEHKDWEAVLFPAIDWCRPLVKLLFFCWLCELLRSQLLSFSTWTFICSARLPRAVLLKCGLTTDEYQIPVYGPQQDNWLVLEYKPAHHFLCESQLSKWVK